MAVPAISTSDEADIEKTLTAYPAVIARGGDETDLAACSGVDLATVERLLDRPDVAARLEAARIKADHEGKTLVPLVRATALKLARRVYAEADTVDAAGAAELLRPMVRILENADRVRLHDKGQYANLPVIHFTIGAGHAITTTVARQAPAAELVEDVTPKEVPSAEPAPVGRHATQATALVVAFDAEPMPLDEDPA